MTAFSKASKDFGSRKKLVTPISRSWSSASISCGILAQPLDEFRHLVDLQHLHAPLDPASDRPVLVAAEIVARPAAQQSRYLGQMIGGFRAHPVRPLAPVDLGEMPEILAELQRDFPSGGDEVHQAGGDGAAHHAVIFGALLGDRETAMLLDRPEPERAVAARAGQDHAGRVLALRLGQGEKEAVDGHAVAALRDRLGDPQSVSRDGQGRIGPDHIDMIGLDLGLAPYLHHRKPGDPRQQGG
jgi:hypothetical protein